MNDALSAFRRDSEMLAVRDLPWGLSRHRSLACWLDCLRHLQTDLQCLCTLNDMVTKHLAGTRKVYGRKHKGERDGACSSRSKTAMVTVTMGRVKLDTILRVVNKRLADKLLP